MVRKGEISEDDANHDWRCWIAIAAYFETPWEQPQFPRWDLTWADLAEAAAKALRRREVALLDNTKPELAPGLEDRRDAVAAMTDRLRRTAEFYRKLNEDLRREAEARRRLREAA